MPDKPRNCAYYDFSYKHTQQNGYWQFDYYKNNETCNEVNHDTNGHVVLDRTIPSDESNYFGLSGKQTIQGHTYGYGVDYNRLRYGYGWHDVNDVGDDAIYPSQKVDLFGAYVDDTWQMDKRWKPILACAMTALRDARILIWPQVCGMPTTIVYRRN